MRVGVIERGAIWLSPNGRKCIGLTAFYGDIIETKHRVSIGIRGSPYGQDVPPRAYGRLVVFVLA
jgi:hypothetical protein